MLVAANDPLCGIGLGSISEGGAVLDQCLVCKEAVGNENVCVRTHLESEDWTILCMEILEKGFRIGDVLLQQFKGAYDGYFGRPRRKGRMREENGFEN